MLISPLPGLDVEYSSLIESELPVVVHGPIESDIGLLCQDSTVKAAIDAANFINTSYPNLSVNVVQLRFLDKINPEDLQKVFSIMKYSLIIQSRGDTSLQDKIRSLLFIEMAHELHVNSSDSELVSKIVSKIKEVFLI